MLHRGLTAPLLQEILLREVPPARALGITVERCDARALVLRAPLELNRNLTGTAFGGSLASLAMLAGWGFCWSALDRHGLSGTVVIQRAELQFLRPVDGELVARCSAPPDTELETFLYALERRARARLALEVTLGDGERTGARFTGTYVATVPRDAQ